MTFRLANDEVLLSHGGHSVRLRPSLRAVSVVEQEFGFERLLRRINERHLSTIAEVIRLTAVDYREADAFLKAMVGKPLGPFLDDTIPRLVDLVRAFIPEPVQTLDRHKSSTAVPWPDVYRNLYHTATGWLGWTPRQTWQATPNEINHAFAAHIAMLKATGVLMSDKEEQQSDTGYTPERLKQIDELGYDPAFDASALRAFKAKIARGVA